MEDLRYYLDGPGEVLIMDSTFDASAPDVNKILCVVTCKTASFRGDVTEEKVTGGRSIFPKRKYLTDRSITFELEDCEMDFRYLSITQGEAIVVGATTAYAFGEDYQYTIDATTGKVTLPTTPLTDTLVVQFLDDGTLCTEATTPAGTGEYSLSGKELTFTNTDKGKDIKVSYQFTTGSTAKTVSTKTDSLPKTVKLVHKQPMFDQDNAVVGHQFIEIYKAQPSGGFEEAYQEKAAFAPKLSFEVLDPKRVDKKMVDHKIVPVA